SALNRIRQRYLGLESQFFLDLYGGIISVYATGMSLMGMEKETEDLKSTLNDPRKTQFVAVTIPEAMGIYETEDLLTTLKTLGIPLKHIVINRVVPDVECGFCQSRRKTQRKYVEEVYEKFPGYRVTEVPLFPHEVRGIDGLTEFAEALFKPNGIIQGDRSK
ncbi:MAG: ArsA family ATPase, partial [Candidatus Bathyarchaeia archaeon]